jgi:hypothetical protein
VETSPGYPLASNITGPPFNTTARVVGGALATYTAFPPAAFDPCSGANKTNVPVSVTANTRLIIGRAGTNFRICSIFLLSTSAETFSVVEGTGSTCGTATGAVIGATTAANGPSAAANGGYAMGNGLGAIAQANVPGNDLCILISGSTLIAGNMMVAW